MIRLKRILVATDFSEPSDAAVSYGRELARSFGAHLQIVNVVDNLAALVSGTLAVAIVNYSKEAEIDLIVMGTHARGGHFLMGSVAETIVRSAPCPVLTVRHPEHEFVLPDTLVAIAPAA
jgi:nucleotide-binding universal stress UspA family protein